MFDVKSIFSDGSEDGSIEEVQHEEAPKSNVVPEFTSRQEILPEEKEIIREVTQVVVKDDSGKEDIAEVKDILSEIRDGSNEIPTSESLAVLKSIDKRIEGLQGQTEIIIENTAEIITMRQNQALIGKVQIALSCVMIGMIFMYLLIGRLR